MAAALLLLSEDHPRLGIHSVSQQPERPGNAPLILMVYWAVAVLAATLSREPSESKKGFPMSSSASTPPYHAIHHVMLSIFCAKLEKRVLTKCWRKQLYTMDSNSTDE